MNRQAGIRGHVQVLTGSPALSQRGGEVEPRLAEISSVRTFSTKPHFLDLLGRIQRNMKGFDKREDAIL